MTAGRFLKGRPRVNDQNPADRGTQRGVHIENRTHQRKKPGGKECRDDQNDLKQDRMSFSKLKHRTFSYTQGMILCPSLPGKSRFVALILPQPSSVHKPSYLDKKSYRPGISFLSLSVRLIRYRTLNRIPFCSIDGSYRTEIRQKSWNCEEPPQ